MNFDKKAKTGIGIGSSVIAIAGLLANMTSVLSFFGISPAKESNGNESSLVESVIETTTVTDDEPLVTANNVSSESEQSITEKNTSEENNISTSVAETLQEADISESTAAQVQTDLLDITYISTITDNDLLNLSGGYNNILTNARNRLLKYDKNRHILYWIENCQTVMDYNFETNEKKTAFSTEKTTIKFEELVYNQYTDSYYVKFKSGVSLPYHYQYYDFINNTYLYLPQDVAGDNINTFFIDDTTALLYNSDGKNFHIRSCNLSAIGENEASVIQNGYISPDYNYKFNDFVNVYPIIHNDQFYYMSSLPTYDKKFIKGVLHTHGIFPSQKDNYNHFIIPPEDYHDLDTFLDSIYIENDQIYCTIDNSLYKIDFDSMLNFKPAPDDLLSSSDPFSSFKKIIDSTQINTTYKTMLNTKIINLIYVNDKCFIALDGEDNTIKVIGNPLA